jgi:hypothetical protein
VQRNAGRRHAATLLGARSINDPKLTTKYVRYPGNALDRQILEFQKYVSVIHHPHHHKAVIAIV